MEKLAYLFIVVDSTQVHFVSFSTLARYHNTREAKLLQKRRLSAQGSVRLFLLLEEVAAKQAEAVVLRPWNQPAHFLVTGAISLVAYHLLTGT